MSIFNSCLDALTALIDNIPLIGLTLGCTIIFPLLICVIDTIKWKL